MPKCFLSGKCVEASNLFGTEVPVASQKPGPAKQIDRLRLRRLHYIILNVPNPVSFINSRGISSVFINKLAMSLKSCCATGSLHTGTPTGRVEKVHGLDCYIADAPNGSSKGVIVIIPDAFGWELPNNRILADDYAKNGFKVLLPEFQAGTIILSIHCIPRADMI